ncbi:MAG: hypothetical protein U0264_06875 [Candidatus Kapaibacterium sp.]
MKKLIVTILFMWLSVGVFAESWAQGSDNEIDNDISACVLSVKRPRIFIGLISAIHLDRLSNYQPNDLNGNPLTAIEHETHIGYSFGTRLEYLLGIPGNSHSFITADVMFGRMGLIYSAHDSVLTTTSEKMLGQYSLTTTASAFTLNAYYTHLLPGIYLGITAGITTNYIFNVEHAYSVSASKAILPSSSTIATSDSGRTAQYLDAATNEVNSLQLGLIVGLRYDILIRKSILTPFVQFEYGINGMLSGGQARPMMVRAGCAWIFGM